MADQTEVLLITKGHPFAKDAFFNIFDEMADVQYTHVEHPAAQLFFHPEHAVGYDTFVLYDMPGIVFAPGGPVFVDPPAALVEGFTALLDQGFGLVCLHHAIAGWPAWPEYAEMLGGRFLYLPGALRGEARQDSGYRHEVTHSVSVLQHHPVTAGLPANFAITDELYLYEVFEQDVTPLLASDHEFTAANFYSAAKVVREGKMFNNDGWQHAPGSRLIGWVKRHRNSPIVYLQCGDGPDTYKNEHFRVLLRSAILWAASPEARAWARARV